MKTYLAVYLGSLLLAVVLTPIVIFLARALKIYDNPNARKVHAAAIPRIGGVAVFFSAIVLVIITLFLDNSIGQSFREMQAKIVTLLAAGTFIFLVGLVDDLRPIRARYKLAAQIIAALAVCMSGIHIDFFRVDNLFTLNFGWFAFPITIFWIVAITNAVNLIDGLDGLAAGISAITCAVMAVFAINQSQPLMAVLMLGLLGSLSGFLFFNFNPARVFMGDSGSMFLGFTMASASVICATKSGTILALALPALALGLPIFDTIFSMLRRYLNRRAITSADRGHLHHILLDMGFGHRHVVILMYAMTAVAAGLGMVMMLVRGAEIVAVFFCVILLLIVTFRVTGAFRIHSTIAALKRNFGISQQSRQEVARFEEIELHFRAVKTFGQWWQTVCLAADKMDFISGSLHLTKRDGTVQTFVWRGSDEKVDLRDVFKMTLPVRDRRIDSALELKIEVRANGSLESAARRGTLFTRLIEGYSIASLPQQTKSIPKTEVLVEE